MVGSIDYLGETTIDRCVNTGSIRCNNNTFTQVGYYCAAGIVSRFQDSTATVVNCVNAGQTSHAAVSQNAVAICYNYEPLGHTLALNVYLHNTGNGNVGSIASDFYIIAESASNVISYTYSPTDYYSVSGIDSAIEATKKATSASELGDAAIKLISKLCELQTHEEYLASAKQEKLAELDEKRFFTSELYTAENYKAYSNAYDEIALAITSAEDKDSLSSIKVKDLLIAAELLLLNSEASNNGDATEAPIATDATQGIYTQEGTLAATDEQTANKGCKSIVASGVAIALTSVIICGAVATKKKKEL